MSRSKQDTFTRQLQTYVRYLRDGEAVLDNRLSPSVLFIGRIFPCTALIFRPNSESWPWALTRSSYSAAIRYIHAQRHFHISRESVTKQRQDVKNISRTLNERWHLNGAKLQDGIRPMLSFICACATWRDAVGVYSCGISRSLNAPNCTGFDDNSLHSGQTFLARVQIRQTVIYELIVLPRDLFYWLV